MSELHRALSGCDIYPETTSRVEHIETHVSHLYLTDSLVYKIKKKVDFGFCNFTSLARRHFYCREEVRLNRRLAPDCYLGVSKIVRQGDRFLIDQPGEVQEYAVRMRRLPQDKMLDRLLCENAQADNLFASVENIGQRLARFHGTARQIDKSTHDDQRTLRFYWQQNFEQTRNCPETLIRAATFETVERIVIGFLGEGKELFERRQDLGYVRDGHGDLHCEHICLTEPLQIFDCIEFNPDLRWGDILSDLAFLTMDLEKRGRTDLAQHLWQSYQQNLETGPGAGNLLRFYCLYRAWVRAKVHHFQIKSGAADIEHQRQARDYFRLACSYALPQTLLLCCGLIGSGKTTVAGDLGSVLRAPVFSSDRIRSQLEDFPEDSSSARGRYRPERRLAVYRSMAEQAEATLAGGRTLIVDATFENQQMRTLFLEMAKRLAIPYFFIESRCDPVLIRKRLQDRSPDPEKAGGSEAGLRQFESQQQRFEPLSAEDYQIGIDTGQPREYNVDFLLEKLLQACGTLK